MIFDKETLFSIIVIIILFLLNIIIFSVIQAQPVQQQSYTGCYICSDNTHVKFYGQDTVNKRRNALTVHDCQVVGTIQRCESVREIK